GGGVRREGGRGGGPGRAGLVLASGPPGGSRLVASPSPTGRSGTVRETPFLESVGSRPPQATWLVRSCSDGARRHHSCGTAPGWAPASLSAVVPELYSGVQFGLTCAG